MNGHEEHQERDEVHEDYHAWKHGSVEDGVVAHSRESSWVAVSDLVGDKVGGVGVPADDLDGLGNDQDDSDEGAALVDGQDAVDG